MRRLAIGIVLTLCAGASQAESAPEMTAPIDLSSPEATVFSMMRAMYQGRTEMVDQVFLETATLRRVTGEGEVRPDGLQRWRDWVGTLEPGDAYEDVFGVTSHRFGRLASVWAPFVITYQGERIGCGVNQITLAQTGEDWRVVFAMDTSEPKETCGDFKARVLAGG
ncbi:MAG: hypothetical protein AAFY82_04920 [Pseudomonadota bacterium]